MKINKTAVIIVLSILLVFSLLTQALLFTLLEIDSVASLKQVMLVSSTFAKSTTADTAAPVNPVVTEPTTIPATTPPATTAPTTYNTEPRVLIDTAGIKVTFLGVEYDAFWETWKLKLAVENNSQTNITLCGKDYNVDGFMVENGAGLYCDILAGKKSIDYLSVESYALEGLNITNPKTIEFKLTVVPSDNLFTPIVETDTITISLT
jgi:hypothetical protein